MFILYIYYYFLCVALIVLCLASTGWTQEILADEQNFNHPGEPQDIQESNNFSLRRQTLNIRSNAARRLQAYHKRGMFQSEVKNPTGNERTIKNREPESPAGSFRSLDTTQLNHEEKSYLPRDTTDIRKSRPNSRIGFRRRIDRFRAESAESDSQQQSLRGEDQIILSNEFPQSTEQSNFGDEERGSRFPNHLIDISQNNNMNGTILSLDDGLNSYHNDNRHVNDHTLLESENNTQLNDHITQETSEVRSNFNQQWENQDFQNQDQQQVPENFNGNERGIAQNNIGLPYRKFRINNKHNIGRQRLRIPFRRRIYRLRGPNGRSRFLQRNIRVGLQRNNQTNENRQQLNTDDATPFNRKIDPSLLFNPNENAQKILQLDEQYQPNSGNAVLSETLSRSEVQQESSHFNSNVSEVEDMISTSEREEFIDTNQNQNSFRPNFLQRPSQTLNFRTTVRRPNNVSVILGSNNEARDNAEIQRKLPSVDREIPKDLTDAAFQTQELPQHSQIRQQEHFSFSERKIIPVQFIANRPQKSGGNSQSGFDHQFHPQLPPSSFQQQDLLSSRQRNNEPHNTGNQQISSGNEYSTNNQDIAANQAPFGASYQPSRLQPDNFQRLSQFQQQIENKRLLQYNQQQNPVLESSRRSQKSALQRQLILEDQRLLQYPRQQTNRQTSSQHLSIQDSIPGEEVVNSNSLTQESELNEDHGRDTQIEKVSYSPQYLADQYFKPAQLTDAFGPGRRIVSNHNQQQSQESPTKNPVISQNTLSNYNIDQQISSQNSRKSSGSDENAKENEEFFRESINSEVQNYENTRESADFKNHQNVLNKEFQGHSAGQSHFATVAGTKTRQNDEYQQDIGRGRQNVPAIPGRVEPNAAFPPRTPNPQVINRDHHDIQALDRKLESNVNIPHNAPLILSPTDSFREGVDSWPSQNLQFVADVPPAEIQRSNSNIVRPESFSGWNSQQNRYLPQYESNYEQIQNSPFSSVINNQSFVQNKEQEFGTRNRERNNQRTSVISDDYWYSDSRQTITQPFGKPDNSYHNQFTGDSHESEIQFPASGWKQNPILESLAFNPHQTFTEQEYNQNPHSDSSFNTRNWFSNVRQDTSNVQQLPRVKPESDTPQIYLSEGKGEGNIPEEFSSANGFHSSVPDNFRPISQQSVDEHNFHQQPATFNNRRTSFGQGRPSEENVSEQEFSNPNYLPDEKHEFQNVYTQENNQFRQNVKISNAHGQPGFTYQRNSDFQNFNNIGNPRNLPDHLKFVTDSRQSDQSYLNEDSNSQSQFQTEHLSTHNDLESSQASGDFTGSFQYQMTGVKGSLSSERNLYSSTSRKSGRGSRKFLDTIRGANSQVPQKDLLETIAAMLQGGDFIDRGNVSTKVQRVSNKPRLTEIPETGFRCEGRISGYYADAHRLARCRSFHFCGVDGSKISYLCPAGTVFNQRLLVCDHIIRVECSSSADYYHVNERLYGANVHQPLQDGSRDFRRFGRRV